MPHKDLEVRRKYQRRRHTRRWNDPNQRAQHFARRIRHLYSLERAEWDRLLIKQAGRCAICTEPMTGYGEPAVDHNHETGQVRELLCRTCNLMLGKAHDRADILRAGAAYITRHNRKGRK